ncbi:uncharacterized protein LOC117901906 [Drosophila subobscura]|uniref:uncharacterized protein LOC117901906 n=1 Tax=Drosophila subobscura TaxID=7241 RepID=UPI00155A38C7|nr:uncharacterized protein LOC117901906 [Drosophila subobscura]
MQNISNRNEFHPQNWRQIARREGLPDDEIVVIIDKSVLKVFRRNVYCLAVAFCLVTVTPWTIIEAVDYKFTSLWNIPFYIWLFMAFFCQAMLACFPQTRYTPPCNWILVLLVVLLLTMFGSYFLYLISIETFLVALLTASVVLAVLHVCGAYCPQVVLPNTVCTGCVLLVCLITLLVDGLLLLMMVDPIYRLVFCIVIFTLVLMMIPFNSQYINGRLKFTPIADTLVCALAIYTHFIIMLLCLCAFKYYFDFYIDQVVME